MSRQALIGLGLAAGGLLLLATRGVAVPGAALDAAQVRQLAANAIGRYGFRTGQVAITPEMVTAIAWIESAFNPTATRLEPHIGDASIGLMQTLLGTARDLAINFRFNDKGVPDFADLLEPETSMYFGVAYLSWLSTHSTATRVGEEFVVRAYNGGPGNWDSGATEPYWARYRDARRRFG